MIAKCKRKGKEKIYIPGQKDKTIFKNEEKDIVYNF